MNKQALVGMLAEIEGISKAEAGRRLDSVLDVISIGLKEFGEVTLSGICKLKISERSQRTGRNPNTGEALIIPAKSVLKVKQSSMFTL